MDINEFRYMWHGRTLKPLASPDIPKLAAINEQTQTNEYAILLLHGFSSTPAVFRLLVPALRPLYGTIVAPVLPGHADNLNAFGRTTADAWLKATETRMAALLKTHQHVDVLGLSLGGLLACFLSQRFTLRHLYLLAPALSLRLHLPRALFCAHLLHRLGFKYLRNHAGDLCSPKHGELAYRQLPLTAVIEILTLISRFQYTPSQVPTDLFLGCHDHVVNTEIVAGYFQTQPKNTLHWLPNSAHVLPLDNDLDIIIDCIKTNAP